MSKMMRKRDGRPEEKKEFDQYILDLARVTRVTEGGKHMSFRALVIIGDRRGRVGYGLAKGKDVQLGVEKSVRQAKKSLITVPLYKGTIAHPVIFKFKAAEVMIKPAPAGSGIIAGGAVRAVLELAGVQNVSSKILSRSKNKVALVKATFGALGKLRARAESRPENRPEIKVEKKPEVRPEAVKKAIVKESK